MTAYAPHYRYIAPAQVAHYDLPRLVLGMILIEAGYHLGLNLVDAFLASAPDSFVDAVHGGTSRTGLMLQLFSFVIFGIAAMMVTKHLHERPAITLFGPPAQVWSDLKRATAGGLLAFGLIEFLPPYYSMQGAILNAPIAWISTLPLAMFAILIQTGAEEIVYRGYLQQQIAARFRHPAIWLIVPNLLFASAHWDTTDGVGAAQAYVIWAFFFGLAASDLTARSGTIGAAIGFHLANNAFAFMAFGTEGHPDSGLALILFPAPVSLLPPSVTEAQFDFPQLTIELLVIAILWLAARIAIKR